MILKLFLNAFFVGLINSINNNKDEIINLPELKMELSFKHYSGFLEVFPNTRFFHYWFVESQNNPSTDPLIFWFNGGPGCSSIDGLLNEMGPYIVEKDGKSLKNNPNSWTKYASIVYIESPAGVGYSYSKEKSITLNDDQTALDNYNAIKQFFSKFPDFKHHSVFIMGESYGGVYVPMLTKVIIDGLKDFNINLKGVAIGNGYVNKNLNIDTSIRFAYSHGLIDEQLWKKLEQHCCNGCIDDCTLYNLKKTCKSKINQIFNFIWSGGLNPYDLYQDCDVNSKNNSIKTHSVALGVMPSHQVSASLIKKKKKKTLTSSVPCLSDFDITTYMNDPKVRKAIHIPSNFQNWSICSEMVTINYEKQYDDMSRFILKILDQNVPVLLYYGDTDMACNFLLGQQFSEQLNLKRIEHKKAWKFNHQIAGFKTIYDKNLTFLTIRGAGHMAPQWKAPQMDYVISKFLKNDNI